MYIRAGAGPGGTPLTSLARETDAPLRQRPRLFTAAKHLVRDILLERERARHHALRRRRERDERRVDVHRRPEALAAPPRLCARVVLPAPLLVLGHGLDRVSILVAILVFDSVFVLGSVRSARVRPVPHGIGVRGAGVPARDDVVRAHVERCAARARALELGLDDPLQMALEVPPADVHSDERDGDLHPAHHTTTRRRRQTHPNFRQTRCTHRPEQRRKEARGGEERRTGLPTSWSTTRMACCHAVSALRSSVASPVPVIALTQQNSRSTYLAGNLPLLAYAMAASTSGVTMLGAAAAVRAASGTALGRQKRRQRRESVNGGARDERRRTRRADASGKS